MRIWNNTFFFIGRISVVRPGAYAGYEQAVLAALAQLEMYCTVCGRHIDMIHIKTLSAAAQ